jgi:hypothetical protein
VTRERQFGDGTPFGDWLRVQKDIDACRYGFTATDADWIFCKYKDNVRDAIGVRDVQLYMFCETKTRGSKVLPYSQHLMLFNHDQVLRRWKRKIKQPLIHHDHPGKPVSLWHFGVFVLSIQGVVPEEGSVMSWGQFDSYGMLTWRDTTSVEFIKDILSFKTHPRKPDELINFSRHHKTSLLQQTVTTELGFDIEETVRRSS